jgi:potassium-transporting ATPase KdpC subunit
MQGFLPLNPEGLPGVAPDLAFNVLIDRMQASIEQIAKEEGVDPSRIPADAVYASGSGLDPDISPEYAEIQVARVAGVRGLTEAQVQALVAENTSGRQFGILGEPRVNVLQLNLALDALSSPS